MPPVIRHSVEVNVSSSSEKSRRIQGRLANVKRNRPEDAEALEDLRRDFGHARLEDYITRTLATFPPLTPQQREHLAGLLQRNEATRASKSAAA